MDVSRTIGKISRITAILDATVAGSLIQMMEFSPIDFAPEDIGDIIDLPSTFGHFKTKSVEQIV